nr:MAG TPA: Protein of unknown function (DUF2649) [Caudoviricetes sp.]
MYCIFMLWKIVRYFVCSVEWANLNTVREYIK